jgi:hypothetical protein
MLTLVASQNQPEGRQLDSSVIYDLKVKLETTIEHRFY